MKVRLLTPALTELSAAAVYYEDQVAGLEKRFLGEVDDAFERMLMFP